MKGSFSRWLTTRWPLFGLLSKLYRKRLECAGLREELDHVNTDLQALVHERALLADRLEQALADRKQVWDLMTEALAEERQAYKTMINIDHQRQYGIAPYPEAAKLPAERVPQKQDGGAQAARMIPSQAVHQAEEQFQAEFMRRARAGRDRQ